MVAVRLATYIRREAVESGRVDVFKRERIKYLKAALGVAGDSAAAAPVADKTLTEQALRRIVWPDGSWDR